MKKLWNKIKIFFFMAMLVLPGIVWYSMSVLSPKTVENWDYDMGEKRQKTQMPSFSDEDYVQQLEACYNDHIPFRSILISWEQKLTGTLEFAYNNYLQGVLADLIYGKRNDTSMDISQLLAEIEQDSEKCRDSYEEGIPALEHESEVLQVQEASYTSYGFTEFRCLRCGLVYRDDFEGKIIDNSFLAPVVVGEGVLLGRYNWLFYTGGNSISYYRGTNLLEEEKMAEYLDLMLQLKSICDERGIKLQFMIIPDKEQMYPEYMPTYKIADPYKRVDRWVDYVQANSDINIIYPIQELKKAELYWQTYYQYDTHWNCAGAYIGTQALYEALGIETTDLRNINVETRTADQADLIILGGLDASRYPADQDYVIEYKPEITAAGTEGNKRLLNIYYATADCKNEQNFVMLGDSFRCVMIDYLEKDFSHCAIAHRDYVDELHDSIREADVLVLAAVERDDSEIFETVKKVTEILLKE